MRARVRIAVLASMVALMTGGGPMLAQDGSGLSPEELDNVTAEVAAELRCLVCRGQSVLESSSQLAQEMRALIREKLAAGETPDEVKAYFVRSYGDYILLKPRAEGVSLLVYLLPALALLGGGLLLFRLFGRWTRPAAGVAAAGSGPTPTSQSTSTASPDASLESQLSAEEEAWLQAKLQGE